jgi:hypothetical protein
MNDLPESLAARQFFANRLEAYFRAHPTEWVSIIDLMKIGGPSWRSRIACDLRIKRGLNIVWNRSNLRSAYRWYPTNSEAASEPSSDLWPIPGAPSADQGFHLTPPEHR